MQKLRLSVKSVKIARVKVIHKSHVLNRLYSCAVCVDVAGGEMSKGVVVSSRCLVVVGVCVLSCLRRYSCIGIQWSRDAYQDPEARSLRHMQAKTKFRFDGDSTRIQSLFFFFAVTRDVGVFVCMCVCVKKLQVAQKI